MQGRTKTTIRQLRQERGWTQLDLAARVGVTRAVISRWERGVTRPWPRHRMRLADHFGISVEDIAVGPAEQVPQDRP